MSGKERMPWKVCESALSRKEVGKDENGLMIRDGEKKKDGGWKVQE